MQVQHVHCFGCKGGPATFGMMVIMTVTKNGDMEHVRWWLWMDVAMARYQCVDDSHTNMPSLYPCLLNIFPLVSVPSTWGFSGIVLESRPSYKSREYGIPFHVRNNEIQCWIWQEVHIKVVVCPDRLSGPWIMGYILQRASLLATSLHIWGRIYHSWVTCLTPYFLRL